jgi:hypothetical protein
VNPEKPGKPWSEPGKTWSDPEYPGKHLSQLPQTPPPSPKINSYWFSRYLEKPGIPWKYLEIPGKTRKNMEIPGNTWNRLE